MTSTTFEIADTHTSFKALEGRITDNVKTIRIRNVTIDGDEDDMILFFKRLRGHPALEHFFIANVVTTANPFLLDVPVSSLFVSAPRIQTVHIDNTRVSATAIASVSYCSTIKALSLPRNGYTDRDAAILADALSLNSSIALEMVDLTGNQLSDAGGRALERCLEKNTFLRTLRLEGNGQMSGAESAKIHSKLVGRVALAA